MRRCWSRKDGQPARLVLDLAATDRASFMRTLALDRTACATATNSKVPLPRGQASGDPRPLIVIDPGHGGPDTGTKAGGGEIMEKNVVLEFATRCAINSRKAGNIAW